MNSQYIQDRVDYLEEFLDKLREEYNDTDDEKVNPLLCCILDVDSAISGLLSYVTYLEEEKE